MNTHVHTGFAAFLFAGISALVFLNLVRLGAAKLADNDSTEVFGKTLGALVTFK